ncbi:MAG: HTTM domain-containing protein [Bacteroidia bacterium]
MKFLVNIAGHFKSKFQGLKSRPFDFRQQTRDISRTDSGILNNSGNKNEHNASSLAYFRVFFGFMMLYSSLRFLAKGWVNQLYVDTTFHFKYWGFEWVEPLGNLGTHALFIAIAIAAFMVMIGWFYQIAIVIFFILFSYAELIDATNYLNHYYFISIVAFMLIWLPANTAFSIDALKNPSLRKIEIPKWNLNVLKLQIGLVYFFAGVAKLNYDWLIEAEPLYHWLRSKYDFPILGPLFQYKATAYFFSWSGCLYDLSIPFLLLYKRTRPLAFAAVVLFHIITRLLFPIGVFPFVMIGSATLFFSSHWHKAVLTWIGQRFRVQSPINGYRRLKLHIQSLNPQPKKKLQIRNTLLKPIFIIHFIIQLALPFRHVLYSSNLYWSEEGYRFSWRVMLTDKAGVAFFKVKDELGKETLVNLDQYLTERQQKYVATNPDFMVQMAKHIKSDFETKGYKNPKVFVESYLNLNGKGSQAFTNSKIDIANQNWGLKPKNWILSPNFNKES